MIINVYQKNIIILEINHRKKLHNLTNIFSSILCVSNNVTDLPKAFLNLRSFLCVCVFCFILLRKMRKQQMYIK